MQKLNSRLRSLRSEANLSQQEFAAKIGVSKSSINMYERGEREPSLETLECIADFFNVDMNYLLGKSDIRNSLTALHELEEQHPNTNKMDVPAYTPLEQQIIKNYRTAFRPVQQACLRLLEIDESEFSAQQEKRHA